MMYERYVKRALDMGLSLVALPIVGIVGLPIGVAIKLEDGGSVFYCGERYGKGMRKFPMYKFRSMKMGAADIRNADGTTYNSEVDDRQTKVGRFLRKTSLDELPQLLNVLKGDMSLVGPRPSPMGNEATYTPYVKHKFKVRPGITGLNQALKRNSATLQERYDNDVYYAEHVSLVLDIKILAMTVQSVLLRKNIYHNEKTDSAMEKDYDLRAHQLRALEAMKMVDTLCAEHGIKYFLIAGSALGAVRHKGFIPWDDDIDIVMTHEDFSRFLDVAAASIKHPYTWRHTTTDDSYPTLTGGIYYGAGEPLVTVFPLVKLSDNMVERKVQWLVRKVMSPVWQRKVGYRVPKEKMNAKQRLSVAASTVLAVFIPRRRVLDLLRANEVRYEADDVAWYCNIYSRYSQEKESIQTQWVEGGTVLVPFEDTELPILKDYDVYLKHLYGDYMTLPPESERHPVHL